MNDITHTTGSPRAVRPLIAVLAVGLAAIFVASLVHRLTAPSIQVTRRIGTPAMSAPPAGPMPPAAAAPETPGTPGEAAPAMPPQGMPPAAMGGEGQGGNMGEVGLLMRKLQQEPNHVPTLLNLSERFMRMQSFENAAVFLMRAVEAEPANKEANLMLGVALEKLKRPEQAAEAFSRVLAADVNDPMAHYQLGLLYKRDLNRPAEAREHFQAVLNNSGADASVRDRAKAELEGLPAQ